MIPKALKVIYVCCNACYFRNDPIFAYFAITFIAKVQNVQDKEMFLILFSNSRSLCMWESCSLTFKVDALALQ